MTLLQSRRTVSWMERAVLLLAVAYLGLHTLPRGWNKIVSDYPNYYLPARLAHEGYDTARMHEWIWFQREKDHRSIDLPVIGLIPITPFSTLIMWPLTGFPALEAKHVWIVFNLALLAPLCWFLRSLSGLSYRRAALVLALSLPLHRNLLYGQFYLFLLVLIVAACWSYLKEFYVLSGALIAVAAACKIFPGLFIVFFLRRRAWRALASAAITGVVAAAVSVAVFGWNVHRTYLHEVLPWTLRGEGVPPYRTSAASFSSVLHYLLLSEPQWNPHPWHSSPLLYALLQPSLQMLVLAPAILFIRRRDRTPGRVLLEWAALLTASLAISTMPAFYHFVLMVFPICVLSAILLERKKYLWLILLFVAYLGIGFPMPSPGRPMGLAILLYMPRLPLMLAVLLGIYVLLGRDGRAQRAAWDWTQVAWAALMVIATLFSIRSALHLQRAVRQEYAYRIADAAPSLFQADPIAAGSVTRYLAATLDGYYLFATKGTTSIDPSPDDDLSFTADSNLTLVEKANNGSSNIVDTREPGYTVVEDGQEPMLSLDGRDLAFVRADYGRGRLMLRRSFQTDPSSEIALTPPSINVYEGTFISERDYAFSGAENGGPPQIYLTSQGGSNVPLGLGESRYPALSPDEHWMAFSRFENGSWNLWVRDQKTGKIQRVADVPCNQIEPSWEKDSKTLVYATDCGRSLWLTAISRRRVIP